MKIFQKKQIVFIFVATFLLWSAGSAAAQTEKEITAIRAEVNSINRNSKKHTKKTKNVEGLSLEGAEAVYSVADREIKKIAAKIYGETYRSTAEIYYKNDRYDAPIGATKSVKIISTEEQRIYFADGVTIKVMSGNTVLKPSDARYTEIEKSLVELSEALTAAYSK